MESPEIAAAARDLAVMVRIAGPDPKGVKFRRSAFHLYDLGKTTLSASGFFLPDSLIGVPIGDFLAGFGFKGPEISGLVVTVGSLVEPFLPVEVRTRGLESGKLVELINGAQIDVLAEFGDKEVEGGRRPAWMPVEFVALYNIPEASDAIRSLIEVRLGLKEHSLWEAGWNLDEKCNNEVSNVNSGPNKAKSEAGSYPSTERQGYVSSPGFVAGSATRIALLGLSSVKSKDRPSIFPLSSAKRGELLLVMGSPFGVLSPFHFLNSVSVGTVANCCPPGSYETSILMADIRCLPGMEGGPVFGKHADFIGILVRPLRQRVGGAEVQIVVTWPAIAKALRLRLAKDNRNFRNGGGDIRLFNFKVALRSIVLVSVSEGSWASGVVLSENGLILTNAHVLEPWRFGRNLSVTDDKPSATVSIFSGNLSEYPEASYEGRNFTGGIFSRANKGIRVQLHHVEPPIWCNARAVYVSRGPLDVALLQLEFVPPELPPIIPEYICPSRGAKACVIGHGLFGPSSGLWPSVSSGVVSKVVEMPKLIYSLDVGIEEPEGPQAAVLVTTASVHPGASGGAIVNSDGHMIGLVTSNAKHGSGTFIPHLNFSIPCAALKPIFNYSDTGNKTILSAMDKPNEILSSLWALKSLQPHFKQPQQLPNGWNFPLENKDGKGSRFASFLAEREGGEIVPQSSHGSVVLIKNIPSKL